MKISNVIVAAGCLIWLCAQQPCQADSRSLWGAMIGAGTGAIIANNVHGVSSWVAVPVGALAGVAIANETRHSGNDYYRDRYGYDNDPRHYYRGYGRDYRRNNEGWRRSYPPVRYYEVPVAVPVVRPQPAAPDMQPGVDLIKVSITHNNGTTTDVPILRIGNKFVGPQGEEYATLPTAKELAVKYGM